MTEELINKIKKRADGYAAACFPYEEQFIEREAVVECCVKVVEEATKELQEEIEIIKADRNRRLERLGKGALEKTVELEKQNKELQEENERLKKSNLEMLSFYEKKLNENINLEKQIKKMKSEDWHEIPAPPKEPKKTIASAICDNACQVCPYGKNCDQEVEE